MGCGGLFSAPFQAHSPWGLAPIVGSNICPGEGEAEWPWSLSALQVEGAFVQGLGLFTLEELQYSPEGSLHTRGPRTYKIPAFGSIPSVFRVSLLRDCPNKKAIYASKVLLPWVCTVGGHGGQEGLQPPTTWVCRGLVWKREGDLT